MTVLWSPDRVGLGGQAGHAAWTCWAVRVSDRKPYKSDLSDEHWALIEPVISAWKADHPSPTGHHGRYEMREIVNAILYQGRTGCQWDHLPHDLPPKSAVSRVIMRAASSGLVANAVSGESPAAWQRSGWSVHERGMYSSRSTAA